MPDETVQQLVRAWIAVGIQALVAIIAIWQDRIRSFLGRPKLVLSAKLAEPDCDLTRFSPPYQVVDGAEVKTKYASCYYLRLRVRNTGQRLAEKAEVYVENVEMKKHGFSNAKFTPLVSFPPMRLIWAHVGSAVQDLGPDVERFCDLGYVVDPQALIEAPGRFELEVLRKEEFRYDDAVFTFDLEVKPNHGGHIVGSGDYRVHIAVGAANAKPVRCCLELKFSGKWQSELTKMYSTQGIQMQIVPT